MSSFEGHTIEVLEDGLAKRVFLLIDGHEVASESCILPQEIRLKAAIDQGGASRVVTATIVARLLASSLVSVEIDGTPLALEKQ